MVVEAMDVPDPDESAFDAGEVFQHGQFLFTTGLRAGEIAEVRSHGGEILFTYRSFANVVAVVASLVAAIVGLAGLAGTALLTAEGAPLRALSALALTAVFFWMILRLVPRTSVTLFDGMRPVLTIAQHSHFPVARYRVARGDGQPIGELARSALARLGRNRWRILQEGRLVGEAGEDRLREALIRKILGKFSHRWETNVHIEHGGMPAGKILRRPDETGQTDVLVIEDETLDPRLSVALATIVLGSET